MASFLIGWDVWVVPSNYNTQNILYCCGFSLLIAIAITVPLNFVIRVIQKAIRKQTTKKWEQNNEKDFLDQ